MRQPLYCIVLAIAALGLASSAHAQTSGNAMLEVKEIVLQHARIGDLKAADYCGFYRGEAMDTLSKLFKQEGMPVTPIAEIKPPVIGQARIDLFPEVVTLDDQSGNCISWIALTAQSQNTLRIPPVETPRSVIITYWRSGLQVSSSQSVHGRVLINTLQKLARQFAEQYKLDQPPTLLDSEN
ncbi:MAG: hypothetical protein PHX43_06145 [Alphaproteobacteria bacterium]|nr:hypothetical protein [Alphaproteobacteria bacterium]